MKEYYKVKKYIVDCHNQSQKVVFTHGVFDLFHKGHLKSIKKAKEYGDVLIIGIDSDELVRNDKGKDRPIISERDRKNIVENIKGVDFVFMIKAKKEDYKDLSNFYFNLYNYLEIDVVVSGPSKYRKKHKEYCSKLNIQYESSGSIIESTTEIINKIRSIFYGS
jgi:cytidyltransferase-like protein